MLSKTLQNFLDKNKIRAEIIEHKTVYTAFDKSATLKVKPTIVGKTVIISFDGKNHVIGLIPANKNIDKKKVLTAFNKLRQKSKEKNYKQSLKLVRSGKMKKIFHPAIAANYKKIDFANEKWMKTNIKNTKPGATPPFGAFYGLPFFIDNLLIKQSKIIVNGGEYEFSLKLSPLALIKLDSTTLKGNFSMAKK